MIFFVCFVEEIGTVEKYVPGFELYSVGAVRSALFGRPSKGRLYGINVTRLVSNIASFALIKNTAVIKLILKEWEGTGVFK